MRAPEEDAGPDVNLPPRPNPPHNHATRAGRTFVGKSHEVVLHYDPTPGLLRCPLDALQLECHEDVWTALVVELYYSGGARGRANPRAAHVPAPACVCVHRCVADTHVPLR